MLQRHPALKGLIVLALLAPGAAVSAGDTATCGMLAVTDVVLTEDLSCDTFAAIRIGADAITIDLNGHTLRSGHGYAVLNDAAFDFVTVRNGAIEGDGGIRIDGGAQHNTLAHLTLIDTGIDLYASNQGLVYRNRLTNGSISTHPWHGGENLIQDNTLEYGDIHVHGKHNTARGNTLRFGDIRQDDGLGTAVIGNRVTDGTIRIRETAGGLLVVDNHVTRSPGDGILVGDEPPWGAGEPWSIVRNKVSDSAGHGISVREPGATLTANHASRNGGCGIYAPAGAVDGGRNRAVQNEDPAECIGVACR